VVDDDENRMFLTPGWRADAFDWINNSSTSSLSNDISRIPREKKRKKKKKEDAAFLSIIGHAA